MGRRGRLKIAWPESRAGSSPAPGTTEAPRSQALGVGFDRRCARRRSRAAPRAPRGRAASCAGSRDRGARARRGRSRAARRRRGGSAAPIARRRRGSRRRSSRRSAGSRRSARATRCIARSIGSRRALTRAAGTRARARAGSGSCTCRRASSGRTSVAISGRSRRALPRFTNSSSALSCSVAPPRNSIPTPQSSPADDRAAHRVLRPRDAPDRLDLPAVGQRELDAARGARDRAARGSGRRRRRARDWRSAPARRGSRCGP